MTLHQIPTLDHAPHLGESAVGGDRTGARGECAVEVIEHGIEFGDNVADRLLWDRTRVVYQRFQGVDNMLVIPFPAKRDFLLFRDVSTGEKAKLESNMSILAPNQQWPQDRIGVTAGSDESEVVTVCSRVDHEVDGRS
jgi:hypothetical protein